MKHRLLARVALSLVGLVTLLLVTPVAHAEVFHTAEVLEGGKFRLAFEPQIMFGPDRVRGDSFIGYARLGFGIGAGADMEVTGGFFRDATYLGLDIEFQLLRDGHGYPALSVTGGAHFWFDNGLPNGGYPGLDGALILSEDIRDVVVIFAGIDSGLEILPNRVTVPTRAIGGVDIVMSPHFHLVFEVGISLHEAPHHISGGPTIYF